MLCNPTLITSLKVFFDLKKRNTLKYNFYQQAFKISRFFMALQKKMANFPWATTPMGFAQPEIYVHTIYLFGPH